MWCRSSQLTLGKKDKYVYLSRCQTPSTTGLQSDQPAALVDTWQELWLISDHRSVVKGEEVVTGGLENRGGPRREPHPASYNPDSDGRRRCDPMGQQNSLWFWSHPLNPTLLIVWVIHSSIVFKLTSLHLKQSTNFSCYRTERSSTFSNSRSWNKQIFGILYQNNFIFKFAG